MANLVETWASPRPLRKSWRGAERSPIDSPRRPSQSHAVNVQALQNFPQEDAVRLQDNMGQSSDGIHASASTDEVMAATEASSEENCVWFQM